MGAKVRPFIVGTAGHVDHGKSALVLALTGTDPDRLPEEKARGITIDLGFAHMDLGNGLVASFVDVPGHERFVRHMVAGAHGIDAALLVVAADESVMPQTREHFEICRLLGLRRGIVALTKCDLADDRSQAIAEAEARALVHGSFLETATFVRVSVRSGEGLAELRSAIESLGRDLPAREAGGPLRLPIDRVFAVRGFGTVVTGTLIGGTVGVGEDVELLPGAQRTRVRGMQIHGQSVASAGAGTRVAVNLQGIEVSEVERGDVLTRPETLRATSSLGVEIAVLADAKPLPDGERLRVHVASAERLGRVRPADGRPIAPGSTGFAELRLEAPTVAGRLDHLILRSYSPQRTIAGAIVLDPLPARRKGRTDAATLEALRALIDAPPADTAAFLVALSGEAGSDTSTLAMRLTVSREALALALVARTDVVALAEDRWISRRALDAVGESLLAGAAILHERDPLRVALSRAELRARAAPRVSAAAFERALGDLAARGALRVDGDAVALPRHEVRMSAAEEEGVGLLLEAASAAGLAGALVPDVAATKGRDPRVLERAAKLLVAQGRLVRVGSAALLTPDRLDSLRAEVRRRWPPGTRVDVGGVKELTGLSRKYVIPLLEYLDRERVTRRLGSDRVVL